LSSITVTPVAGTPPKFTESWPATPVKFTPCTMTGVPPVVEPDVSVKEETTGVGSTAWNSLPSTPVSACSVLSSHWSDGEPLRNHALPLSATIMP
jgi:hypothetical protein